MATNIPAVTVHLIKGENTHVDSVHQIYNLVAGVDLKDIWNQIIEGGYTNKRLYINAYMQIPILQYGVQYTVDLYVDGYFNVVDIVNQGDKLATLYGVYEGEYEDTRKIVSSATIWCYTVTPYVEEG